MAFPTFIALCFLSGVIADWIISAENHTSGALVITLVWLGAKMVEHILDTNGAFLEEKWRESNEAAHRDRARTLYVGTLAVVAVPYICFHSYFGCGWDLPVIVAACVVLIVAGVFPRIWTCLWDCEAHFAKAQVDKVVREYCTRSLLLTQEQATPDEIARAPRDEVERASELVTESLLALQTFKPIHHHERVPGLTEIRLCDTKLLDISDNVQKRLMEELTYRQAMLQVILGNENELLSSVDILSRSPYDSKIVVLKNRRRELAAITARPS